MFLLLNDIASIFERVNDKILNVIIVDNCSSDNTASVISNFINRFPGRSHAILRKINLGMVANIAGCMTEGNSKYTWLLSDHQRIMVDEATAAIHAMSELEFDVGYARLLQWQPALSNSHVIKRWDELSMNERGRFIFSIGNISGLIFKQSHANSVVSEVYKSCGSGYPHLGLLYSFTQATKLIEFGPMSVLPDGRKIREFKYDYDLLVTRFHDNFTIVKLITQNKGLKFSSSGFYSSDYKKACVSAVLGYLLTPKITFFAATSTLGKIISANPLDIKILAFFVMMACILLPDAVRLSIANMAKSRLVRN